MDWGYWSVPIVLSVIGIIVHFMPEKRARTSVPDFDESPTETDAGLTMNCPYCLQILEIMGDDRGYTVRCSGDTTSYCWSSILLDNYRKLKLSGNCPACSNNITFEFAINPDVLKQRETSPEKTDREQNTQTLHLLFGLLERTIWICDHNIRNDIGDSWHESFWKRYCEAYIRDELPLGLQNIDKSPEELRNLMLRRAKSVYDVPLIEPPRHDPDASIEQSLKEMMFFNQQMGAEGSHDDLAMRDELRGWLEKDIKQAFDEPEKAVECIENHWNTDTITYFREQDRNGIAYSHDAWCAKHPALSLNVFCETLYSRSGDPGWDFQIPIFDHVGVERSIAMLPDRANNLESLVQDIARLVNTFFYKSSLLSLVTVNERLELQQCANATVGSGILRTVEDWGVDRYDSIAHYVLHDMPEDIAVLTFPDSTTRNANYLQRYPKNFLSIDFKEIVYDDDKFFAYQNMLKWVPPSEFFNDPLLYKEMTKDIAQRNPSILDICSAVVVRLGSKRNPLGLLVVGWKSFYNFGPYPGVLGMSDMKPFLQLVEAIETSLRKIDSALVSGDGEKHDICFTNYVTRPGRNISGEAPLSTRSRADMLDKSLAEQLCPPVFDRDGFMNSLKILFDNVNNLETFLSGAQQVVDTFFYPSSVLSFAIQKNSGFVILNAATYAGIERDKDAWGLSDPDSIANFARHINKILLFPNLVTPQYRGFLAIPFDHYKLFALETLEEQNAEREKAYISYASLKDAPDFQLIRSKTSQGSESGIDKLSSAVLAPLIFNKEFLGAMLIGFQTIDGFTLGDTHLLREENCVDLIFMVEHFAAILAKLDQG